MAPRPGRQSKSSDGIAAGAEHLLNQVSRFRQALAGWFSETARPLPWRLKPSLYATVVSEFMLQQTQVVTVLPYFERWLRLFPDFEALARAPESEVLHAWEGLGYYSRARRLQSVARVLVDSGKPPPKTAREWLLFPGIGPYTAAAVTSIAFDHPAACVDGNVVRILARLSGHSGRLGPGAEAARTFQTLADSLLDTAHPGRHNQAMMELGATVCTRVQPKCLLCPVRDLCRAREEGTAETIPVLERARIEHRSLDRLLILQNQHLLLGAAQAGRLSGIFELPNADRVELAPGWQAGAKELGTLQRSITRFRYSERVLQVGADLLKDRIMPGAGLAWIPLHRLQETTLSGPHRKWLRKFLDAPRDSKIGP